MSQAETATAESGKQPAPKAYSASTWAMHKWAMGAGADYWMYMQFATIMVVFTTAFKLDVRLVGIALFIPRIFDGLLDPLIGHLSDNTHTRWGRRRPFLFCATILGAVLATALWWASPSWPQWALCTWVAIFATLLFTVWGTYQMTFNALGYELSDDYNDRSRVFAIRGVYAAIMSVGGGYFYWLAIALGQGLRWPLRIGGFHWDLTIPSVGGEINGIRIVSGIAGVIILASGLIPVFCCRERFVKANRKHVNLWKACLATLSNRTFSLLLVRQIIGSLGGVTGAMATFISIYYVCRGDKALSMAVGAGLGGLAGLVYAFVLLPLAKPLTKFFGKRLAMILGACWGMVSLLVMILITKPGNIYIITFSGLALGLIGTILGGGAISIGPDICDIDELEYGERREGLFTAVGSFVSKLENSIMMLTGTWFLAYCGFNKDLPVQSPEVLNKMVWLFFTPPIITGIVTLIITFYIPVYSEQKMAVVRAALEQRRAEAAAAEAAASRNDKGDVASPV